MVPEFWICASCWVTTPIAGGTVAGGVSACDECAAEVGKPEPDILGTDAGAGITVQTARLRRAAGAAGPTADRAAVGYQGVGAEEQRTVATTATATAERDSRGLRSACTASAAHDRRTRNDLELVAVPEHDDAGTATTAATATRRAIGSGGRHRYRPRRR